MSFGPFRRHASRTTRNAKPAHGDCESSISSRLARRYGEATVRTLERGHLGARDEAGAPPAKRCQTASMSFLSRYRRAN